MNLPKSKPPEINIRLAFYLFFNFIYSLSIGLSISIADLLMHINELGLTEAYKTHPAPGWAVAFIYICTFLFIPLILLKPLGLIMGVDSSLALVVTFFTTVMTAVAADKLINRLTVMPVF